MHLGTSEQASGTTCLPTIGHHCSPPDIHHSSCCTTSYSPQSRHVNITVTALWLATPFLSTVSVAAVCVAVSTNQWLLTQESIKNENYTGRGENEYFPKSTVSGLWTLCYTNRPESCFDLCQASFYPGCQACITGIYPNTGHYAFLTALMASQFVLHSSMTDTMDQWSIGPPTVLET